MSDGLSFATPGHESTSAELRRVRAERDEALDQRDRFIAAADKLHDSWLDLKAELATARQELDERYRQGALDAAAAVARAVLAFDHGSVSAEAARVCYRAALTVADPQPGTGDET